jgi:hypothetical protein
MKIKEVEVFNTVFQVEGEVLPSPDDTISAYLSDEGLTMSVQVDMDIKPNHIRRMSVAFMTIDYANKIYTDVVLGTSDPILAYVPGETFDVELKPVLQIPSPFVQNLTSMEVAIEPLTYQANVEKSWGLETLTYPHRLHTSGTITYPDSTDGWYRLSVLDLPIWDGANEYREGDVVYYVDGYFKAATDNISVTPTNPDETWSAMTDEDWSFFNVAMTRVSDFDSPLRVLSDLLITRNIKYRYIFECIKATSFNPVDDPVAEHALSRIVALREVSIAYLESGDPIKAVQTIMNVPNEYKALIEEDQSNYVPNTYTL